MVQWFTLISTVNIYINRHVTARLSHPGARSPPVPPVPGTGRVQHHQTPGQWLGTEDQLGLPKPTICLVDLVHLEQSAGPPTHPRTWRFRGSKQQTSCTKLRTPKKHVTSTTVVSEALMALAPQDVLG